MSKIMIVGSTTYPDMNRVRRYVRSLPPETIVITGNEIGVCTVARYEAEKCGLGVLQFYRLDNSDAEKERRFSRMVEHADFLVRFREGMANNQTQMIMHNKRVFRPLFINPEFWEAQS